MRIALSPIQSRDRKKLISFHHSYADKKAHVANLLGVGNLDLAFSFALSSNSLSLVVEVCEMCNPMQVFNQQPCPLSFTVLLSLIQQLGELPLIFSAHTSFY